MREKNSRILVLKYRRTTSSTAPLLKGMIIQFVFKGLQRGMEFAENSVWRRDKQVLRLFQNKEGYFG